MKHLTILMYIVGSVLFTLTAFVKLLWCFIRGNEPFAKKIALQFDDTFNVALHGVADMKFSSRCYVGSALGVKRYQLLEWIIDMGFYLVAGQKRHCYQSYLNDRIRY